MDTKWFPKDMVPERLERGFRQPQKTGATNEPATTQNPRSEQQTAGGNSATTKGEPRTRGRNWWLDIPLRCQAEFRACLRRVCSWRTPPNWGRAEWFEEIGAVAAAAAWKAETGFDPAYGISVSAFVRYRVLGRALTRYRQEWAFASRCIREPAEEEEENTGCRSWRSERFLAAANHYDPACDALLEALAGISGPSSWLIEQLFWKERTEAELGREQGISQRAISKRKHAALEALRQRLSKRIV